MFFKFNQISQSIASATQDMAMGKPASANSMAATLKEAPQIHYEYSQPPKPSAIKPQTKSGYPVPNNPTYKRLMEMQSRLSLNDGKLVWQKLPKDMPLYYITLVGVTVGVVWSMYSLKMLAAPPKND